MNFEFSEALVDFSLFYQLRNNQFRWMNAIFYFACVLLIVTIFCYCIFAFKVYLQSQKINELDKKLAVYGTDQQKESEKKVLDYKKKIDDFTTIINSHKISLNVFSFIEEKTLPDIWFSSINVSEVKDEINLSGESKNMETLSRQIKTFEESKDYIKDINVLNSQVEQQGKIIFTLNLSLNPNIFTYYANGFNSSFSLLENIKSSR